MEVIIKFDHNDVLVKAELINMRSRPRHAGWYLNGQLYRDLDLLSESKISKFSNPKPLFYYP